MIGQLVIFKIGKTRCSGVVIRKAGESITKTLNSLDGRENEIYYEVRPVDTARFYNEYRRLSSSVYYRAACELSLFRYKLK